AAPPANSWSRSSFGIAGSLRRDIVGFLFTHYARPYTEILTVPLREMIGFAAERLMELAGVGAVGGLPPGFLPDRSS
ncbi:hypothetical protein, partial [Mesorhizobium caraganae]|uniref:hypothetical protein n=1 Tax=Mesorhizobium caraganae TaxID=483206 RepID=UPI001AEF4CEF